MHKIIILEGADGVGKSGSIDNLVKLYQENDYQVLTMFNGNMGVNTRNVKFEENEDFGNLFRENENFFNLTSCNIDISAYWIKKIFDLHRGKKLVIIFDRFYLSSLVFGTTLRKEHFEQLYGSSDFFIKYFNIFERRMEKIADVQLFCFINSDEIENGDDRNENIKLTKEQVIQTNENFELAFEFSVLKKKSLIRCKKDEIGYFDTFYQLFDLLKQDLPISLFHRQKTYYKNAFNNWFDSEDIQLNSLETGMMFEYSEEGMYLFDGTFEKRDDIRHVIVTEF